MEEAVAVYGDVFGKTVFCVGSGNNTSENRF